jgi:serine/threonine protein kinase
VNVPPANERGEDRLPCLDEDAITDLVAGRRRQDSDAIERHLDECATCVRLLAAASALFQTSPSFGRVATVLAPGTVLKDSYSVVRLIGRGGMGEVYEARHVRLSGRYAIKVLRAEISDDGKLLSRFRREAEITSSLHHPNIVHVLDFDRTPDGCAFLAMEYLAGADLATLLRNERRLALDRMFRYTEQIVSALSAVHNRGIVHRDLKPENVFVVRDEDSGEERVKLMDFGLSKWSGGALQESLRLSRDQTLIGTPRYMAPEQAMARNKEITPATDQFGLAALVYEMLAGAPAFDGDSLAELLHAIVYESPVDLRRHRRDLNLAIVESVHRGLSKVPEDRFPSVQAFFKALTAIGPRLARRGKSRTGRRPVAAGLLGAALLLAGSALWWARGAPSLPAQPAMSPSMSAAQIATPPGRAPAAEPAPAPAGVAETAPSLLPSVPTRAPRPHRKRAPPPPTAAPAPEEAVEIPADTAAPRPDAAVPARRQPDLIDNL